MDFQLSFKVNEHLYLKDPETSELGKQIVKESIDLIHSLGIEHFTFKKLAVQINTTEATIYRYFENKQKLLLYILNWYWSYMAFLVMLKCQNIIIPEDKLITILEILTHDLPERAGLQEYNHKHLNEIIVRESTKAYLIREVNELNKEDFFKPYKALCANIADVLLECNPSYPYPRSLSSTMIETAHAQQFFAEHLPRLTDVQDLGKREYTYLFLKDLVFKALAK